MEQKIMCPLIDRHISIDECMENREIKEKFIPEEFKEKEQWKDICQKCKYYDF
ncbi:MAG: hypothetical protein LIO69_00270 [Oscillospiraceae bacterium]|nr:hypothetical protein [Oscillospiraceae bacterium]